MATARAPLTSAGCGMGSGLRRTAQRSASSTRGRSSLPHSQACRARKGHVTFLLKMGSSGFSMSALDDPQNHATRFSGAIQTPVDSPMAAALDRLGSPAQAVSRRRNRRWQDFGWALLYMSPALALFLAFTYVPFMRSILLSFYVTTPTGAPS